MSTIVLYILYALIGLAMVFCLVRLIKGPTSFDRVMGLDSFNIIVTGAIVVVALVKHNDLFLDVALIYAMLSFLETVALSRFLEGRGE